MEDKYPSLSLEVVLNEKDNTVRGLYFQVQEMRTAFERLSEVIRMEATHNTNSQDMSMYTLSVDGNGEGQVAAMFLVQRRMSL